MNFILIFYLHRALKVYLPYIRPEDAYQSHKTVLNKDFFASLIDLSNSCSLTNAVPIPRKETWCLGTW